MKNYVSIDIGGTAIKYGVVNENGEIIRKNKRPTEAMEFGGPGILKKVCEIVEEYKRELEISGVSISTAGMIDTENGSIFHAGPNIPNYTGINFKKTIKEKYNLDCEVENDVNCAALAEYIAGASKGSKISLMLTVGTGIGGCAIIDGKVLHGFSNCGCEVGYMKMEGGDFQELGAASVLTKKVAQRKNEDPKDWSGLNIFNAAKAGDEICIKAIDEMVDVLGKGIANICCVLNPEVVVLGGGIMAQEEYLYDKIDKAMKSYMTPPVAANTTLKFAKNQNNAGMLGSYYHFLEMHKN